MNKSTDVLIIGSGLTGLTLAKNLEEQGKNYLVLDARDRIGGRINTIEVDNGTKVEMGATWFFPHFKNLFKLLKSLNVSLKEQFMKGYTLYEFSESQKPRKIYSGGDNDMFRISGGTSNIVHSLYNSIGQHNVLLSQQVKKIAKTVSGMEVETANSEVFQCKIVVSTIPPQLLQHSMVFEPELPSKLSQIMRGTHTWMGDSVKAVVTYDNAWWKQDGLSGGLYSNDGPVAQMYDQSDENGAAIVGFLDDTTAEWTGSQRQEAVIEQLVRVFGDKAQGYKTYKDTVWRNEPFTMPTGEARLPGHSNVGHSVYQVPYIDGGLYIGGTETSTWAGGFMEGAVYSANFIANKLADLH